MQKAVWKRWVTTLERDQSHKTPITSTWTADFLTREEEGHKTVGDWLRDKTISWKTRRRLLQTNAGVFPCETILQNWGKHADGFVNFVNFVNGTDRWVLNNWGEDLLGAPPDIYRSAYVASKLQRIQGLTMRVFNGSKMT
jgi:hypothetical protein